MNKIKTLLFVLIMLPVMMMAQTKQNNFEISKSIDIYNNVLKELNQNYVDEINPGELNETAIKAMLDELDPYTVFIPESQIEDYRLMTTGEYGGIGAVIQYNPDYVLISEPYEGFPAQKAGLIPGDAILEVNGIDAHGKTTAEVSELLKGQPGTTVTIKIKRYNEKEPLIKVLTREKVKINNIPYSKVFENGIGYIILTEFTKNAANDLRNTFLNMKKEHQLKGLIIDLRNNGGGLLKEAVDIVNIFVPKNKLVVYTKGKTDDQNYNHFTKNEPDDTEIPLVILVNESSASASEIVAGSIQDFDRGIILGQRTFGKGLVQNILPMSYNTQIKVTVAKYYIPSRRCIQEIDYSKKKKSSSDTLISDTLINKSDTLGPEFKTANGRIVYEGHGIQPDVKVKPEMMSTISINLYAQNMFFKYANKFFSEHKSIEAPDKFVITDNIYNDFIKFTDNEKFTYTSSTEKKLAEMKKTAKAEGYLEMIQPQIELLEQELKSNKEKDILSNRKEIEDLMKFEIIGRYYYQKGKIISTLQDDPELHRAFEILLNTNGENEYEKILKGEE